MLAWLAKCLIINRSPGKKPTATERASEIRKVERAQVESHNVEPTFSFILIQLYHDGQLAQYQEKALSETCHRTYYPSCLHQRFPRCELWKPSIFVGLGGLLTGGGRRDRSDGIFRLLRSGLRLDGRERGRRMRSTAARANRTPEGSSSSFALSNLKSLRHFLLLKSGAIWAAGEAGKERERPMHGCVGRAARGCVNTAPLSVMFQTNGSEKASKA